MVKIILVILLLRLFFVFLSRSLTVLYSSFALFHVVYCLAPLVYLFHSFLFDCFHSSSFFLIYKCFRICSLSSILSYLFYIVCIFIVRSLSFSSILLVNIFLFRLICNLFSFAPFCSYTPLSFFLRSRFSCFCFSTVFSNSFFHSHSFFPLRSFSFLSPCVSFRSLLLMCSLYFVLSHSFFLICYFWVVSSRIIYRRTYK